MSSHYRQVSVAQGNKRCDVKANFTRNGIVVTAPPYYNISVQKEMLVCHIMFA